jgi:hypothetical protein
MTRKLTVSVPGTCTAWYLVRFDMPEDEARSHALHLVENYSAGCVWRMVQEMAASPEFTIAVVSGDGCPEMTPEQRELVGDHRWVSVRATCPTGLGPEHEWVAREVAGRLARSLKAQVADMLTGRMLTSDEALAALDSKETGITRTCDWVAVAFSDSEHDRKLALTTRGMRRYGLPELRLTDVPATLAGQYCALLTGLAFRLHEEFANAVRMAAPPTQWPPKVRAKVRIPDEIGINSDDVAAAYCLPGSYLSRRWGWRWTADGDGAQRIGLAFGAEGDVLDVRAPRDWPGSASDFMESLCKGPMSPTVVTVQPYVREFQVAPRDAIYRTAMVASSVEDERRDMLQWMDVV